MSTRAAGVLLALVTATISGFAVFLNGYAVKRFDDATVYTTAKNGVAGILLVLVALPLLISSGRAGRVASRPRSGLQWAALLALGVIGGEQPNAASGSLGRTSPRSGCSSPGRPRSRATPARSRSARAR